MSKPSVEKQHLRNIEWFKSRDRLYQLSDQFKLLVQPGDIKKEALHTFLLELPYENFRTFAYFKAIVRQHIYSAHDLMIISNTVSQAATLCYLNINKAFQQRVKALDKETALHSHVRAFNCWQILKNALADPVQLQIRGSGKDITAMDESDYALFTVENEEFEELNHGNLG